MQDFALDDLDQRLIHAIQISPRAAWTALAPIVGVDAVTLARRWARLRETGLVYATGYATGGPGAIALIEIECTPGETLDVAAALIHDPQAVSIDITAGGRDIVVTLAAPGPAALSQWTLERIRGVGHVRTMRTHLVSHTLADASSWRLRALTTAEAAAVTAIEPAAPVRPPRLTPEARIGLLAALGADGRASASAIGAAIGVSAQRVRNAILAMRRSGQLAIRVDVARAQTPWPISAWYFLRVPSAMVAQIGPLLTRLDEVRLVVNTVGQYNVIMAVWLRTLQDVGRLEAIIEDRLPGVTIVDRSVVLRTVKHMGHFLDAGGFATGEAVPIPYTMN